MSRSVPIFRAVARSFGEAVTARAEGYLDRIYDVHRRDPMTFATVVGTRRYEVRLLADDDGDYFSDCSCPVGEDCKHGAALALYLGLDSGERKVGAWLDSIARAAVRPPSRSSEHVVLYVLAPQPSGAIGLEIRKARPSKRGGWTTGTPMRGTPPPSWVGSDDAARIDRAWRLGEGLGPPIEMGDFDAEFVAELATTGRLVWEPTRAVLRSGPWRHASLAWCWHSEDKTYSLALPGLEIVSARTAHYIDPRGEIGPVDLGSDLLAAAAARAPRVPAPLFPGVRAGLDRLADRTLEVIGGPAAGHPVELAPPALELDLHVESTRWNIEVTPSYRARYGNLAVALGEPGGPPVGDRDLLSEAIARRQAAVLVGELPSTKEALVEAIGERLVPRLRASGWAVEVTGDIEIDPPEVPAEWIEDVVPETAGGDWFYYSLGVELDGKRTELLPLLLKALRDARLDIEAVARGESDGLTVPAGRGRRIYIPGERLTRWLRPLIELNLRGLDRGRLHLPGPVVADVTGELSTRFAELPELARARERLAWDGV